MAGETETDREDADGEGQAIRSIAVLQLRPILVSPQNKLLKFACHPTVAEFMKTSHTNTRLIHVHMCAHAPIHGENLPPAESESARAKGEGDGG